MSVFRACCFLLRSCVLLPCGQMLLLCFRAVDVRSRILSSICQGLQMAINYAHPSTGPTLISLDLGEKLGRGLTWQQKQMLLLALSSTPHRRLTRLLAGGPGTTLATCTPSPPSCDADYIENALAALLATNRFN